MVLLLWRVDVILRNGYGIYGQNYVVLLKINELQYVVLFVVSGSIEKLFSIDFVNIYFSQTIVNYIFFNKFKSLALPHVATAYIVIH